MQGDGLSVKGASKNWYSYKASKWRMLHAIPIFSCHFSSSTLLDGVSAYSTITESHLTTECEDLISSSRKPGDTYLPGPKTKQDNQPLRSDSLCE